MAEKQYTQVMIDGRPVTMGGDADVAYMQQIAEYVDGKIQEMKAGANYNRQTTEDKRTMLLLNIADDYYQQKARADLLEQRIEDMEDELDQLRHELVHVRMQKEEKS